MNEEKTLKAIAEHEAGQILLQQRIAVIMYEVVAKKISHSGVTVAFGPKETIIASTAEVAKDKYKAKNPSCVGDDLVGYWSTTATGIYQ